MEIDQSILDAMPLPQRQRLMNQMRREQVRRYNDWFKKNPVSERSSHAFKVNKKGTSVNFELGLQLSDADSCYDDRLGKSYWERHGSPMAIIINR